MDDTALHSLAFQIENGLSASDAASAVRALARSSYQNRARAWLETCLGLHDSDDITVRGDRLLEETLQLLQSTGYDPGRVVTLRDYVYRRPPGTPRNELGGVMLTLSAFASAAKLELQAAAEAELRRVEGMTDKIREKNAGKLPLFPELPSTAEGVSKELQQAAPPERWCVSVTQGDDDMVLCIDSESPAPATDLDPTDQRLILHVAAQLLTSLGMGQVPHIPTAFPDLHPATSALVNRFAYAMATRLLRSQRRYGYTDQWRDPRCVEKCRRSLQDSVHSGDPLDLAYFAAFLWHHGAPTHAAVPSAEVETEPSMKGACGADAVD